MKYLSTSLLFLFTILASGQIETGVRYYTDNSGTKAVRKGPYMKEVRMINDSIASEIFSKTKDGQILWEKSYLGDQPYGTWTWYDRKGNVASQISYDFIVNYNEFSSDYAIKVTDLESSPVTNENSETLQRHIRDHFRYPEIAQRNGIEGTVTVQFTVGKNGEVDNLSIFKGAQISLDAECYRIMSSLKSLKPYEKDGQKVVVYYTLPIRFRLGGGAEYRPTEVFFSNGKTLNGYGDLGMDRLVFKKNLDGMTIAYQHIGIDSIQVQKGDSITTYQFRKDKQSIYLMEVLVSGEATLLKNSLSSTSYNAQFGFMSTGGTLYYIGKKGALEASLIFTEEAVIDKNFKKTLKKVLKSCPSLIEKLDNNEYRREDLEEVVRYFNKHCYF